MKSIYVGGLVAALSCLPAEAASSSASEHEDEKAALAAIQFRSEGVALDPMVVTAAPMIDPRRVITNPRQPRLPLPSHDGGSYLKSIPGFALSRKGGTSGEPAMRGLGGSRLNILIDDTLILGGCGGRMDPPTAYTYPEAFDQIEIIKGPQSVRYGASSAAVVRFERTPPRFDSTGLNGYTAATVGQFGRRDLTGEVTAGSTAGFARITATHSTQDDYSEPRGRSVHSRYERWSTTAILGWTPGDRTLAELTIDRSDGQAAYDDRRMDGTRFDRTGYKLRLVGSDITAWWRELELTVFHNYIDHVMDNFTFRAAPIKPMIRFPDRRTRGSRLAAEFAATTDLAISAGLDWSDNRHADGVLMGSGVARFGQVPREKTAKFEEHGGFIEIAHQIRPHGQIVFGARADRSTAAVLAETGFGGAESGSEDRETRLSGFVRYNHAFEHQPVSVYVGIGRSERSPDFWERQRLFGLDAERQTQLDLGARYQTDRLNASIAVFYGQFNDYILIAEPVVSGTTARNIGASSYGGELDMNLRLGERLRLTSTLAWVRSDNDSDHLPLAQTPPPEVTIAVDYDDQSRWFGGALWRGVARQDRIHPGHGTIYSLDTSPTPGFSVLSVYGGRRLSRKWTATAGIDNLLDRFYEEHLQLGSADLGVASSRIPEPGRSAWLRVNGLF